MQKFSYEARDTATGKIVKSSVQADSESAAARLLNEQGLTPLSIKVSSEGSGFFARIANRVTTKDKIVFTRQLATLIGAGLPLAQSLRTVADQTENKRMQSIAQDILTSVEGGRSLSDAFSKHKDVFGPIFLALIAAGEASGTLDKSLQRIAAQQEKDAATVSKIKGALTYPMIVLAVILMVVVFMLVTVVPQVENLYEDLGKQLPWMTQLLVSVAGFVTSFWYIVLTIVGFGVYFFVQYLKTEQGVKLKDTFKLNVPIFKGMFRKLYMTRLARTSQTLLSTGVSMLDTLRIVGDAMNNTILKKSIERAAEKVKGGKELSSALQPEEYILKLVPQMIKIGEQSGKIDEMMGKTAQVYEDELEEEIKTISTMIEPILMVVLAIVAGGMVAAILFPIYRLVGGINI